MKSKKEYFQVRQCTKKYIQFALKKDVKKFRIIPQWEKDPNLQSVNPTLSRCESFIVKRKEQIQKNRWIQPVKQLSSIEIEKNNNAMIFHRRMSIRIEHDNQAHFFRFLGVDISRSLPQIDKSFRVGPMFERLTRRTQPYWKKFMPKNKKRIKTQLFGHC